MTGLKFCCFLNPLPNNKTLDMTKLKAFADNKLNIARMMTSLLDKAENSVGKRRKCWLPQCFPKPSSLRSLKVRIVR